MARCRGCGRGIRYTDDKYCEECSLIRRGVIFMMGLACFFGLSALAQSNPVLWVLGWMLVFYAWLYKNKERTDHTEEAISNYDEDVDDLQFVGDEADDNLPNEAIDSHIDIT